MDYAQWLSTQFAALVDKAEVYLLDKKDKKKELINKLTMKSGEVVYCQYCKRQTKKHLQYCPTCGKQQIMFLTEVQFYSNDAHHDRYEGVVPKRSLEYCSTGGKQHIVFLTDIVQ